MRKPVHVAMVGAVMALSAPYCGGWNIPHIVIANSPPKPAKKASAFGGFKGRSLISQRSRSNRRKAKRSRR